MSCITALPEYVSLKSRAKTIWMAGDYDLFSRPMQPNVERFVRRLNLPKGAQVLDVACGSGNVALVAARDGAIVTGIDLAENAIAAARRNAFGAGLDVRFDHGDVEALPYADASFDYVVSATGAMFAPVPEFAADEMIRVCVPGGVIAMANWSPEGFIGKMFRIIGEHVEPLLMPSPFCWGREDFVAKLFGNEIDEFKFSRQHYVLEYPFTPGGVVEFYRSYYGPACCAFAELDLNGRRALHRELEVHWRQHNESSNGNTRVRAEYLQVIARRATWSQLRNSA